MKICYTIGGLGAGGAERQLLYLIQGISQRVDVTIVSLSTSSLTLLPEFERIPGVHVHTFPKAKGLDPKLIPYLVRLYRRERPHIVHTFLRTANYWGRLAAFLARIPITIASERNIELDRRSFANILDTLLSFNTSSIVVNAAAIKDSLVARGISPQKIEVIRNGVPERPAVPSGQRSQIRERLLGAAKSDPLILFVGRLFPQKNPMLFVEMARRLLDDGVRCKFGIVGDGPLRPALASRIAAARMTDSVRLLGHQRDVPSLLCSADLLVLTSDWEGMPNVVLEALSMGVPAVATDVGGVREIIVDGANGFVVPRADLDLLTSRVKTLVSSSTGRLQMGEHGREHVERNFSVQTMVQRTAALYDTLLAAKALPLLPEAVRSVS